jgi:hypothetical protein
MLGCQGTLQSALDLWLTYQRSRFFVCAVHSSLTCAVLEICLLFFNCINGADWQFVESTVHPFFARGVGGVCMILELFLATHA